MFIAYILAWFNAKYANKPQSASVAIYQVSGVVDVVADDLSRQYMRAIDWFRANEIPEDSMLMPSWGNPIVDEDGSRVHLYDWMHQLEPAEFTINDKKETNMYGNMSMEDICIESAQAANWDVKMNGWWNFQINLWRWFIANETDTEAKSIVSKAIHRFSLSNAISIEEEELHQTLREWKPDTYTMDLEYIGMSGDDFGDSVSDQINLHTELQNTDTPKFCWGDHPVDQKCECEPF